MLATNASSLRLDDPRPPEHFVGLQNANTIWTEQFKLVRRLLEDLQTYQALGVIHGDAGLGKTFAFASALADKANRPVLRFELPARTSQRYVARRIIKGLTGVNETGGTFDLTEVAVDELRRTELLLIIDEAQRLGGHIIEYLRMLHDDPETRFALLLVGGNKCWQVLSREPMLKSRVFRRVEFTPWTLPAALAIIPKFHPIYVRSRPEDIAYVNDHWAHGSFREWASFTATAQQICRENHLDTMNEAVARSAFALLGGGGHAPQKRAARRTSK